MFDSLTLQRYEKFNRPPKGFSERLILFSKKTSNISHQTSAILSLQRNVVVVVLRITRHIFNDLDERREIDAFLFYHALCLQQHEIIHRRIECVYLEELSTPDKGATRLADGGTIRISLLQQRLVESIRYLTLGFEHFSWRDALLGFVDINHLPTPTATTQTNFAIRIGHKVGLRYLAFDALWQLACQFNDIGTLLFDGLWYLQHIADFLQYAMQLGIEVVVVVDDTQMRMTRPCLVDLLVQIARQA